MTTAEHFREAASRPSSTVSIAGVPWPTFKVVSLLVGLLVFVVVGIAAGALAPAVLTATAVTTVTWLTLGLAGRDR
ncbi:Uncharacterised protein [Mycolicibacterium aurum]|uniref:Transmembrane protein n=1 Tax=Mycolicibacterium aurum TaxID=1791 RepID=A0A3S4RNB5_MYCAU|nr:hypothetical protein [Mycolicibacterium aurum]VEG54722.1 Uncharacterised protein [Mycolicibacterium aurum]